MSDDLTLIIDRARELKKSKKHTMPEIRDIVISEYNIDQSEMSVNRLSKLVRMGVKSKSSISLPDKCWKALEDINSSPSKAIQSLIQGHAASQPSFSDEKVTQFHTILTQNGNISLSWTQMQDIITKLGYTDIDLQSIIRTLMQENFMMREGDLWMVSAKRLPDPLLLAMGILQG